MKKLKIVIWLLIVGLMALFIYQNQVFFWETKKIFVLDLYTRNYVTPEIPVAVVFVGFFVLGLILTYLFSVPGRMRAGKTIRTLNDTIRSQSADLTALKAKVTALQSATRAVPDTASPPDPSTPATPS